MKYCVAIPCFNHADTLESVINALPTDLFKIVVDDGSTPPIHAIPDVLLLRHAKNLGKARALKTAFEKAQELGFTHVITIDSDAQHDPTFVAKFIELSQKNPQSLIAGVRNFDCPDIPPNRRFMNKFSNFWFEYETSSKLQDTQCGYRCYPLNLVNRLNISFGSYAYEAEILVKTIWAGFGILPLEIPTLYTEKSTKSSHYKPFKDTLKISIMNTKLSFQATFFPKFLLKKLALKRNAK